MYEAAMLGNACELGHRDPHGNMTADADHGGV